MMKTNESSNPLEVLNLIEFLGVFLPAVSSKIPTLIDSGGCGIFAKHLHLTLDKMGFDTKICYLSGKDEEEKLNNAIKNNSVHGHVGFEHVFVKVAKGIFVDSQGLMPHAPEMSAKFSHEIVFGEVNVEILDIFNNNKASWNPVFDRDCEKDIEIELSQAPKFFEDFKNGVDSIQMNESIRLSPHTIKARQQSSIMGMIGRI